MTALEVFEELDRRLLADERPSVWLSRALDEGLLDAPPYTLLSRLRKVGQSPTHHPEGNVWNHTLLVLDEAAKVKTRSRSPRVFMWAALLHDIGKAETTRTNNKGRVTAYDHDKVGEGLARGFLQTFTDDAAFIESVAQLVRYHMQILFVANDLPFADIAGMKRSTDVGEVALLGFCDRLGRGTVDREKEERSIALFLEKVGGQTPS